MDTPPARRPEAPAGFCKRHRETLLTAAFVALVLVVGAGVLDDVFSLGLFPTDLEARVERLIEHFDGPENRRRQAIEVMVTEMEAYVAVPVLLRALRADSLPRREAAAECLRRIAGTEHGFVPDGPPDDRAAAIDRWQAWWDEIGFRY